MKRIIKVIFLYTAILAIGVPTTSLAQDDDAALRGIIEAVRLGWINADGTAFREYFLDFDGARYFEGGGENTGLTDLIEHHVEPEGDAFEDFELIFSSIETHVEGNFAWALVNIELMATLKRDGRVIHNKGRGTYLFRNIDGAWKVVHTNSASRPVKRKSINTD